MRNDFVGLRAQGRHDSLRDREHMGMAVTRYIVALVLLVAFAGPVFAQPSQEDDPIIMEQKQKKKEADELDKRYKSTLKNTDQTVAPARSDPWQNMRGADDSKTKR